MRPIHILTAFLLLISCIIGRPDLPITRRKSFGLRFGLYPLLTSIVDQSLPIPISITSSTSPPPRFYEMSLAQLGEGLQSALSGMVQQVQGYLHLWGGVLESFGVQIWTTTKSLPASVSETSVALYRTTGQSLISGLGYTLSVTGESVLHLLDSLDKTSRYLKAARSLERASSQQRYDIAQPGDTAVAIRFSREQTIAVIAAEAGLYPEEVPYLALALEQPVRSFERWNPAKALASLMENGRRYVFRGFYEFGIGFVFLHAFLFLLGAGSYRRLVYLMFFCIIFIFIWSQCGPAWRAWFN